MEEVERTLRQYLVESDTAFVFPSEVAAEFWRRRSLSLAPRRAVWQRRFLSWDRFKEESLALSRESVPINGATRTLFVADLLRRNGSATPFFASIVNPRFAADSGQFVAEISAILPELARFRQIATAAPGGSTPSVRATPQGGEAIPPGIGVLDPAIAADLDVLWRRYTAFLREHTLFEPSYEGVRSAELSRDYHLFFPEVIEDWQQFAARLPPSRVTTHAVAPKGEGKLVRFENVHQETRSLLQRLAEHLDSGVGPEEIAVTVPNLAAWETRLRFEAELRAVPLDFRQGRSLAEYPEVRVLSALEQAVGSGFSLESLKALFLNRMIPWRDSGIGRALIRFGIDHSCVRRVGERDPWIAAFAHESEAEGDSAVGQGAPAAGRRSAGVSRLAAFYTGFAREAAALVGARSFGELKRHIQAFIRSRLETSAWPPRNLAILQFALDALNDLVEAEERSKELRAPNPYRLWLSYLSDRIYVPRPDRQGIPVYPYRVSAGIAPAYHYIVGATQAGTQVEWPVVRFLRDPERAALGVADRSATEPFFDLYLRSGASVRISCSREDTAGPELPPGYFVVRRRMEEASGAELLAGSDGYDLERRVWSGREAVRPRCYPLQRAGVEHFALTFESAASHDRTREPIADPALRARVRERLLDESGRLVVSPSRLDRFLECPFAFLVQDALGAREGEYALSYEDPFRVGRVMHACLFRFFDRVRAEDGSFRSEHLSLYQGWMREITSDLFHEWRGGRDALIPPVWNALNRRLERLLGAFLAIESGSGAGLEVSELEAEYLVAFSDNIALGGRIDRVSRREEGFVLVDYKKRVASGLKRSLSGLAAGGPEGLQAAEEGSGDAAAGGDAGADPSDGPFGALSPRGGLPSLQIPFYVELLELSGCPVVEASYYDVERGSYQKAFDERSGEGWTDREGMSRLRALTRGETARMAERIAGGDWSVPDQAAGCEDCAARRICRMKFVVR